MATILSRTPSLNMMLKHIWGLLYLHGLTLIPVWTSNYIHYQVWDEINYPFPIFNGAGDVEVWEQILISSHILLDMWLLIHSGIQANPCY